MVVMNNSISRYYKLRTNQNIIIELCRQKRNGGVIYEYLHKELKLGNEYHMNSAIRRCNYTAIELRPVPKQLVRTFLSSLHFLIYNLN